MVHSQSGHIICDILYKVNIQIDFCAYSASESWDSYLGNILTYFISIKSDKIVGVNSLYSNNKFGLSVLFAYVVGVVDYGI